LPCGVPGLFGDPRSAGGAVPCSQGCRCPLPGASCTRSARLAPSPLTALSRLSDYTRWLASDWSTSSTCSRRRSWCSVNLFAAAAEGAGRRGDPGSRAKHGQPGARQTQGVAFELGRVRLHLICSPSWPVSPGWTPPPADLLRADPVVLIPLCWSRLGRPGLGLAPSCGGGRHGLAHSSSRWHSRFKTPHTVRTHVARLSRCASPRSRVPARTSCALRPEVWFAAVGRAASPSPLAQCVPLWRAAGRTAQGSGALAPAAPSGVLLVALAHELFGADNGGWPQFVALAHRLQHPPS